MLLSARILADVANVNVFRYADVAEFTDGDGPAIYFQLIDSSQDRNMRPAGRRYMPSAGATLQVTLDAIDDAQKITRFATQPFANDPSIWMLQLQSTDKVAGTRSLVLVLTESGKVTRGIAQGVISAYGQTQAR